MDTASEVGGPPARARGESDGAALLLRALAGGVTGDDLATAVRHTILGDGAATWVALHVVDHHRRSVDLVGSSGMPNHLVGYTTTVPLDAAMPITDAVGSGTVVVTPLAGILDVYPLAHPYVGADDPGDRTLVVVPSIACGVAVGAVALEVAVSPPPTWESFRRLDAAADGLAVWTRCADDGRVAAPGRRSRGALWLTERQREVLDLVRAGRTNAQIARELDYSTATVKADLASMYRLFGVRDRDELAARAARAGW